MTIEALVFVRTESMITYEDLAGRPAFASLNGLTLADFEALYHDFAATYAKDRQ